MCKTSVAAYPNLGKDYLTLSCKTDPMLLTAILFAGVLASYIYFLLLEEVA